jgi:hypothetical protein
METTIDTDLHFVIPTYRVRDVGETVEVYHANFRRDGQTAPITIFDDSSVANHNKYHTSLEHTKTHNELFYVGPHEKEQFVQYICHRLRDMKLNVLVRNLFQPSYGGNRKFALMCTLGDLVVSADDDMRPYGLIENSPESLADNEISRGKLVPSGANGHTKESFDILQSFKDIIGKSIGEVPANYELGELLSDTATDLESNSSTGLAREHSLHSQAAKVARGPIVKMAQTFRTGTNDYDAVDFVDMFLDDEMRVSMETLNEADVLVNFRPCATTKNWRMDSGVAGHGLPPVFPTRLRFEDYIYRLWIQHPNMAAAHVDLVQTHIKSDYMRNPLASEVFSEAICGLLKRKIRTSLRKADELTIQLDYDGSLSFKNTQESLDGAMTIHSRVVAAEHRTSSAERKPALGLFAASIARAVYDFEPDFFQQNVSRLVDEEVGRIRSSLEIWPTLLEIVCFQRRCRSLPIPQAGQDQRADCWKASCLRNGQ